MHTGPGDVAGPDPRRGTEGATMADQDQGEQPRRKAGLLSKAEHEAWLHEDVEHRREYLEREIGDLKRQISRIVLGRADALARFSLGIKETARGLLSDDVDPETIRAAMLSLVRASCLSDGDLEEHDRATMIETATLALDDVLGPTGEGS
jgi:hypothetical protein